MIKIFFLAMIASLVISSCASPGLIKLSDFQVRRNLTYQETPKTRLLGDLYTPQSEGLHPVVVVIHGGSWDKKAGQMLQISEDLARSGFSAFNIDYRLAPEFLYPAAEEDVYAAVSYLREHAAQFQIDPEQIALWGYSAGAQLALNAGLNPDHHVRAIVAGGTPADFSAWPHSPIVTKYLGETFQKNPKLWEAASPVNRVQKKSPPVFLYHGGQDSLVEPVQMEKMKTALDREQVEVETFLAPNLGHIGLYLESTNAEIEALRFLQKFLPASRRN